MLREAFPGQGNVQGWEYREVDLGPRSQSPETIPAACSLFQLWPRAVTGWTSFG